MGLWTWHSGLGDGLRGAFFSAAAAGGFRDAPGRGPVAGAAVGAGSGVLRRFPGAAVLDVRLLSADERPDCGPLGAVSGLRMVGVGCSCRSSQCLGAGGVVSGRHVSFGGVRPLLVGGLPGCFVRAVSHAVGASGAGSAGCGLVASGKKGLARGCCLYRRDTCRWAC